MSSRNFNQAIESEKRKRQAQDDAQYVYGTIGTYTLADGWKIPEASDRAMISVTLQNGQIRSAVWDKVARIAGAPVRMVERNGRLEIEGGDNRFVTPGTSNAANRVGNTIRNQNIGFPGFVPIDPASIHESMVYPKSDGTMSVVVERITYFDNSDAVQVLDYTSEITKDLSGGVSGLTNRQERWVILYVTRTTGAINTHNATAGTAPLNTHSDVAAAIAHCLSTVSDAWPFHAVRVKAGQTEFTGYRGASGFNMLNKDFIRFPFPVVALGAGGGGITQVKSSSYTLATQLSTTSTTFVDVDATNLSMSVTITGTKLVATISFPGRTNTNMQIASFRAALEQSSSYTADDDALELEVTSTSGDASKTLVCGFTGLSAGTYNLRLQYKAASGYQAIVDDRIPVMMNIMEYA